MAETVVKIDNLVKRYKELIALDHFDLEIKKGEVFGLLGPNGSGKTTTINCLLSLLAYDKGDIEIFGEKMSPVNYGVKKRIGVIMQNVAVFDELTVYENIDYFCGLYITDKATRKKYVDDAIAFVGLEDFVKFHPKKLSGGLLRRLNIACGIAHKPELIILDEPTVAVDPQSRNKILEGILQLNREGATIIYTSHYMEEVEQICTRIAIMDKGSKIAEGTTEELKRMIKNTETITAEILQLPENVREQIEALEHVYNVSYADNKLVARCTGGRHNLIEILKILQENQGDLSALGARRCCSPVNKLTSITATLLAFHVVEMICMVISVTFLRFVLKVDFGSKLPLVYLAAIVGGIMGISMGFFVGSFRIKEGVKISVVMAVSMTCCFFSGLMSNTMKGTVAEHCPIFNEINPAAIISDSFYCLNLYEDYRRFTVKIISMAIYTVLFTLGGYVLTRRRKYASL